MPDKPVVEQSNAVVPSPIEIIKVDYIKMPIAFRPSDEWLLKPIFQVQEYKLPIKNFQPKLILDCGANIGMSVVYFANKYPDAKIIAVEPELGNFRMLMYNTLFYDNVEPVQAALWNEETYLDILTEGRRPTAFMTCKRGSSADTNDPNIVKTTTVSKLLANSGFDEIDLLKVDIEGAEKEVFGADDVHSWLSKTKVIAIELHDRIKRGCSSALFRAVLKYDFYFAQRGENLFFIREDLIS